jgi:ACT domain-containing protein
VAGERLYVVHGQGNDAVGLVGKITSGISGAGGNVLDLRQDVLHGLFTIHLVVDLSRTELRSGDFRGLIERLGEDTGLALGVDKYVPVAREPGKRNILAILIGHDQPGIIAAACEVLGKHEANIEFAKTVAREGIFLMELLVDASHCTIPLTNLQSSVVRALSDLEIRAMFQTEDVFNKKKRVILFDLGQSLIDAAQLEELMEHTSLTPEALAALHRPTEPLASLRGTAELLDGMSADVLATVAGGLSATSDSLELLQTLKVMGYSIVLVSTALAPFTDPLPERLGIEHCYGVRLPIDDDARTVVGEISEEDFLAVRAATLVPRIALREGVTEDDVAVVTDVGLDVSPGIHLRLDLERLLSLYNERALSPDQLLGLVGGLGLPRPSAVDGHRQS